MTNRPKVLLVDDEADIVYIMKKSLEQNGFEVDAFTDPTKALSHFKPNTYHAIILDIRMPEISGFYLAREIWAEDEKATVCFLSAFEIYEAEAKFLFADFKSHCFIQKPIMPRDLVKHVQAHLLPAK